MAKTSSERFDQVGIIDYGLEREWLAHNSQYWEEYYTNITYHSDFTWASCHLKSQADQSFDKQFVQGIIKENIKTKHHWPFVGWSQQWLVDCLHKGPVMPIMPVKHVVWDGFVMKMSQTATTTHILVEIISTSPNHAYICILIYCHQIT